MLLVGSAALYSQGLWLRQPRDFDYIATMDEINAWVRKTKPVHYRPIGRNKYVAFVEDGSIHEFEIAWPGSTGAELLDSCERFSQSHDLKKPHGLVIKTEDGNFMASLQLCYILKQSHKYLKDNPHFNKTMDDLITMEKMGAAQGPCELHFSGWFKRREEETYYYKHPSLKQNKKEFFNGDGITYVYDHDSIHQAVKIFEKPAYTYFKSDQAEVYCDQELFQQLDYSIQLASVLEESYVLAIERSLVPFDDVPPDWAFKKALEKVCTSITSGWWREFAYNNYHQALNQYDRSFYKRFINAVQEGKVALHE